MDLFQKIFLLIVLKISIESDAQYKYWNSAYLIEIYYTTIVKKEYNYQFVKENDIYKKNYFIPKENVQSLFDNVNCLSYII